ncbi:MAG: hypothetical protein GX542_02950, partial [Rhodococcus sp.]|nr:hypothetical protein [Rhodococcus sp. (in: high G+C Gram-positive bacteria)]
MIKNRRRQALVAVLAAGLGLSVSACGMFGPDEKWQAADPCKVIDMDQLRELSYKPDEITTAKDDSANGTHCRYSDRTRLADVRIDELPETQRNAPRVDPPLRDLEIGGRTVHVAGESHNRCSVYFTIDTLSVAVEFHATNYLLDFSDAGCDEMLDILTSTINNISG